jgi:branched-subunit amino acid ABC-type transport system permease component
MGGVSMLLGAIVAVVALALGMNGWPIDRLWFYLLGSAMLFLAGIQLFIYWLLLRILEELSQREILTRHDMGLE